MPAAKTATEYIAWVNQITDTHLRDLCRTEGTAFPPPEGTTARDLFDFVVRSKEKFVRWYAPAALAEAEGREEEARRLRDEARAKCLAYWTLLEETDTRGILLSRIDGGSQ